VIVCPTLTKIAHTWAGNSPDLSAHFPIPGLLGGKWNRSFLAFEKAQDWAFLDEIVARHTQQGLTPIWCLPDLSPSGVEELVTRYPDTLIEAGNEIDDDRGVLRGNVAAQAVQWQIAAELVPRDRLVLGSVQSIAETGHGLPRLRATLESAARLGELPMPRAFSCHVYTDGSPLDQIPALLHNFRGVIRSFYGPSAPPTWVTECGTPGMSAWAPWRKTQQLERLIRRCREGAAQAFFHWATDDSKSYGMRTPEEVRRVWNTALTRAGAA
jgi:hypothetical protein